MCAMRVPTAYRFNNLYAFICFASSTLAAHVKLKVTVAGRNWEENIINMWWQTAYLAVPSIDLAPLLTGTQTHMVRGVCKADVSGWKLICINESILTGCHCWLPAGAWFISVDDYWLATQIITEYCWLARSCECVKHVMYVRYTNISKISKISPNGLVLRIWHK